MDVSSPSPPDCEPRFQIGAIITHPGADAALGEDIDLVVQLVALHLQHAQPYEHGWLSGARYRGTQLSVATVTALKETHVFAAAEARELGEDIPTRTGEIRRA